MKSLVSGVVLATTCVVGASAVSQGGAAPATSGEAPATSGEKKPNIAVSGCLMRQGYATFIVADARIDATGAEAATAAPSSGKPGDVLTTPAKWVLENAGVVGQHVGEKVQVIGVSDWTGGPAAGRTPAEVEGPPPSPPHIEVIMLKVLAKTCA